MELAELVQWWHESLGASASPRTRKLYKEAVDRLLVWLAENGRSVAEPPERRDLNAYFAEFRVTPNQRNGKPLSPSYIQQHWRSLQQFYKWLTIEELIDRNPFTTGMEKPRIPDTPVEVFTHDELNAMFRVTAGKDPRSRRDRAILRVLLDTGVRIGELCGIDLDHVDYSRKTIRVTGKASNERDVPFNTKCYSELKRWLLVRPKTTSPRLFVGLRGRTEALTESGVRQLLNSIGELAGVTDIHPHRFRHTYAHLWLADGNQESDLRRIMGWKSPQMVARYAASAGAERARNNAQNRALGDQFG